MVREQGRATHYIHARATKLQHIFLSTVTVSPHISEGLSRGPHHHCNMWPFSRTGVIPERRTCTASRRAAVALFWKGKRRKNQRQDITKPSLLYPSHFRWSLCNHSSQKPSPIPGPVTPWSVSAHPSQWYPCSDLTPHH